MAVEVAQRTAVTEIEGFVGKVVGFVAGQCAGILIAMGAGTGSGYIGVRMAMLVVACMAGGWVLLMVG